jgi:hypothetical protein
MSDATIFVALFGGLFVLRVIAATIIFYYILPRGDRCPNCDAATVRVQPGRWGRMFRVVHTRWCLRCGWEGILRPGELTPEPQPSELTKHL